jgi:hypothetical protein
MTAVTANGGGGGDTTDLALLGANFTQAHREDSTNNASDWEDDHSLLGVKEAEWAVITLAMFHIEV